MILVIDIRYHISHIKGILMVNLYGGVQMTEHIALPPMPTLVNNLSTIIIIMIG